VRRTLIRWLIHAVSLAIAARLVVGVDFVGDPPSLVSVATVSAVFGLLHAFVKPALQVMACGLYVLTLGLIHFVVNAVVLWITGLLLPHWLHVAGFVPALYGAFVASVVGTLLSALLDPQPVQVTRTWRVSQGGARGDVIDGEVVSSTIVREGDAVVGLLEDRRPPNDDPPGA
jgi:putative membrane protein